MVARSMHPSLLLQDPLSLQSILPLLIVYWEGSVPITQGSVNPFLAY